MHGCEIDMPHHLPASHALVKPAENVAHIRLAASYKRRNGTGIKPPFMQEFHKDEPDIYDFLLARTGEDRILRNAGNAGKDGEYVGKDFRFFHNSKFLTIFAPYHSNLQKMRYGTTNSPRVSHLCRLLKIEWYLFFKSGAFSSPLNVTSQVSESRHGLQRKATSSGHRSRRSLRHSTT